MNKYRSMSTETKIIITSRYRINSDAVAVATRKEHFERKKTQPFRREIRFSC